MRHATSLLERVSYAQVHTPVKVVDIDVVGEETAVTGAEVELQSHWSFEFVFQTEDAVGTAFAEVVTRSEKADPRGVGDIIPAVTDAETQAEHTVETFGKMAFKHKVGVEFEIPECQTFESYILAVETVGGDNLGAEVELEGEMVAAKCLEGECLHVAYRNAEAVFVWSLCLCCESGSEDKC